MTVHPLPPGSPNFRRRIGGLRSSLEIDMDQIRDIYSRASSVGATHGPMKPRSVFTWQLTRHCPWRIGVIFSPGISIGRLFTPVGGRAAAAPAGDGAEAGAAAPMEPLQGGSSPSTSPKALRSHRRWFSSPFLGSEASIGALQIRS